MQVRRPWRGRRAAPATFGPPVPPALRCHGARVPESPARHPDRLTRYCVRVKPAGDERTPDGGEVSAERPTREQLLNVRVVEEADAVVLAVQGDVDGLTVPRLQSALREAFERLAGRPLVLDLTAVGFLGSPGLRALADAAGESLHHRGHEPLRVVVDHARPVIRPLQIVGLDGVLALYFSVADALSA